jgi:hypothetical protein
MSSLLQHVLEFSYRPFLSLRTYPHTGPVIGIDERIAWHRSGSAIPLATTGLAVADQLDRAALQVLEILLDESGSASRLDWSPAAGSGRQVAAAPRLPRAARLPRSSRLLRPTASSLAKRIIVRQFLEPERKLHVDPTAVRGLLAAVVDEGAFLTAPRNRGPPATATIR